MSKFNQDKEEYLRKWDAHVLELYRLEHCCVNAEQREEIKEVVTKLMAIVERNAQEYAIQEDIYRNAFKLD